MKQFLTKLLLIFISTWLCFEMVLRWFDLARFTIPTEQIGKNCMLKPGQKGIYVGGGFGEIQSTYTINKQGWNSTVDFDLPTDSQKIRVALIGDSYVAGMHVDVENSIGRQLDRLTHHKTITHEYGRDGANIEDFNTIYTSFVKGKYDYVFVLLRGNNFNASSPSFMNCSCVDESNSSSPKGMIRYIYSHSAVLSYLNINQFLTENMQSMMRNVGSKFSGDVFAVADDEVGGNEAQKDPNLKKVEGEVNRIKWVFGPEVIVLYDGKLLNLHDADRAYPVDRNVFVEVKHKKDEVLDYGFDIHWNMNGRRDCAKTMFGVIN